MTKKHIFEIVPTPGNLGEAMTSTLAYEAEALSSASRSPAEIRALLMGDGDLTQFDIVTLERQRCYYDASHVKMTTAGLNTWAERRVLKYKDAEARNEIIVQLNIIGFDTLPDDLMELAGHAPDVVAKLLEGRVAAAVRMVPAEGYGDEQLGNELSFDWVMLVIDTVARLWVANDLQMEAAAAFVRTYRPTGTAVLDGTFNGKAPINRTALNRIMAEVELFEEAARIYFGEREAAAPSALLARPTACRWATIQTSQSRLDLDWSAATFRQVGRDATEKEAARFSKFGNLTLRAHLALATWRTKHGNDLGEFIRQHMERGRAEVRRIRRGLERMENDGSEIRKPIFKMHAIDPLTRLWLACERAVALTEVSKDLTEVGEKDLLSDMLADVGNQKTVKLPKIHKRNVQRANRLFFALRCTIAQDPNHLPKGLRDVVTPAGQRVTAINRFDAEALRGKPFSYAEIVAWQQARIPHSGWYNPKEVYSHDYTTAGRKFLKEHQANPTTESRIIDEQAWGTLLWRLGLKSS